MLLELVNSVSVADVTVAKPDTERPATQKSVSKDKSFDEQYAGALPEARAVYDAMAAYVLALGDDVVERRLKLYSAFRRLKNFACVIPYRDKLLVMLKLNPDTVVLEAGFSRDVRNIGTWGTGDLELCLRNAADLQRALPLLERSYGEG